MRTLGYEEVGQVIERGPAAEDIPLGAHIFGTWGHLNCEQKYRGG